MAGVPVAVFEWICWSIAFVCVGIALIRAGVVSSGRVVGLRQKSGMVLGLWVLAIIFGVAGFVLAAAAVQAGGA
ncbi:hypothetical protein IV498_07810 [Paenarthrobacter sp. Z7-10]|uniref:hypothetical protein n=1 Tax=Paenarthrobacter sp. Z7-10 TaxID=2787635 RepID=UPI0022A9438E|nr:hypothetical protein [Paenarthrobacter sp. Z7-10]MCZ2403089.1 hypothetical protein [Paenarthrobacter sp. Z7-10]